jgi:LemA protein
MGGSITVWILLALLLFWAVGAYQRLLRTRAQIEQAFGPMDAEFSQYVVLVQDNFSLTVEPDSPPAQAGLVGAALQFELSLRAARKQPLDNLAILALDTAYQALRTSWLRVQEEPPDLAGATVPEAFHLQWEQQTLQVDSARFEYNQRVLAFNRAIEQFPARVMARLMRLQTAQSI